MSTISEKAIFFSCKEYRFELLREGVRTLFEELEFKVAPGTSVLVKPNLVAPRNPGLSCTHPEVVRAVCEALLDMGARVMVGDSPAFGTVRSVARATGLTRALSGLPVRIIRFTPSKPLRLACGVTVKLAREALCADLIVNLPKFKAHDQLLLTLAVKNLFGCVVGLQKPILHARLGERGDLFYRLILEVAELLPVGLNLMDAIVAMEGRGPTIGRPRNLGFLFAAKNPVALDTALYLALGLSPKQVSLWQTARKRCLYGARAEEVVVSPDFPDLSSFRLPARVSPVSFHPLRLLRGMLKRLLVRLVK